MTGQQLAARIERQLREVGDPGRAEQERRYLKSELEHVGASVPAIRTVAKAALADRAALAASVAGELVERHPELARTLDRWAADEDFWVRRSALLALLVALRRGEGDFARFGRYADPSRGVFRCSVVRPWRSAPIHGRRRGRAGPGSTDGDRRRTSALLDCAVVAVLIELSRFVEVTLGSRADDRGPSTIATTRPIGTSPCPHHCALRLNQAASGPTTTTGRPVPRTAAIAATRSAAGSDRRGARRSPCCS